MKRLAIIITHPIQYYSPLFKLLSERNKIRIKVFYTWEQAKDKIYDKKFGKEIKWDIPLLEGYDYTFVKNVSKNPGSSSFKGVINPTLIDEIEQWKTDAILVFGWNHHSHFKAMRYFKGKIPVLFRGDSTLLDETPGIKTILRRIWLTYVYKYIDIALYVGTNNKAYYLKHGVKEKQLVFAPHAIDNERFFDKTGEYENKAKEWRKELGINENEIVFLFVGKFERKKNPMLLIDAAKQFPEHKFIFVGNGELEEDMKRRAGKNVIFLPFQNQSKMPIVYRLGNIFILPSNSDTWGLAVNEAMACGRAVLISDKVGCGKDLVQDEKNGFIFKNSCLDCLISKMKLLIQHYNKFGENSKKIILNWSFHCIAQHIEITLNEQ